MSYHWGDLSSDLIKHKGSLVLGIDPVWRDIPETFHKGSPCDTLKAYVEFLISNTIDKIGFIKFQSAFFEAFGSDGLSILAHGISLARRAGHGIILDAKRGDIGSTAAAYSRAYLDPTQRSDLEVDCLTVNPFLGPETLTPFLECSRTYGKGLFILVKTSNPGSSWLQDQIIGDETISMRLARLINEESLSSVGASGVSNVGAVVGATFGPEVEHLRHLMPKSVLLSPGVGPQGGAIDQIKKLRTDDGLGVLVPVSRGITLVTDTTISRNTYADIILQRIAKLADALL